MVCIVCLSAHPCRFVVYLNPTKFWENCCFDTCHSLVIFILLMYYNICTLASDTSSLVSCQPGSQHERREMTLPPYWMKGQHFFCVFRQHSVFQRDFKWLSGGLVRDGHSSLWPCRKLEQYKQCHQAQFPTPLLLIHISLLRNSLGALPKVVWVSPTTSILPRWTS